jgi:alkylated DNA repair dioxygenase AlkB
MSNQVVIKCSERNNQGGKCQNKMFSDIHCHKHHFANLKNLEKLAKIGNIEEVVSGLKYLPDYLSQQEHDTLLNTIVNIEPNCWTANELDGRRSLYFGAKYLYDSKQLSKTDIPKITSVEEIYTLSQRINQELFRNDKYDNKPGASNVVMRNTITDPVGQINVHHYTLSQGMTPHTDDPVFGPTVVIVSLGQPRMMRFNTLFDNQQHDIILEPRSALVLKSDAREHWLHSIPIDPNVTDTQENTTDRYSITFRSIYADRITPSNMRKN